ncbi:MAG TPA: toll/interleukin-1 receptor domain-containing protein [Phycisphaerae bacterium]|nr:toll/interleukin-1 receptor domain-containing protein [Phycisphaerae bacterium]
MAHKKGALPAEVFLSHSSQNRSFAIKLAETIRHHGMPVWYSDTNIVGAQQWHDEIGKALARCDWFVLILSPDSLGSKWVKHELLYALNDSRYEDHIVPILYRKCDPSALSWTLQAFQMIDFTRKHADGFQELFRVWGVGYRGSP